MALAGTIAIILLVLLANEYWWRRRNVHGEFSRKTVHITVGSFVAAWPFFLSWGEIQLLSVAFLVVVATSKYFKVFQAIHTVQRPTWGELFFAASVGGIALITHDPWIYAAAVLQMSLADGMAAVMGVRYGGKHRYSVFGHAKSLIGTATFFVISFAILVGYSYFCGTTLSIAWIFGVSLVARLLENVAIKGLDNFAVPLLVALFLINY